jgi:AraC-like DNA-binding protein
MTLEALLAGMRLQGAVFLRGVYTEPWSYLSMTPTQTTSLLQPGAPRVTLMHFVASGRCWVALADGEKRWAGPGDVFVLPYGDQHTMGGVAESVPVEMATILTPPPWAGVPVVEHGAGGSRTDVVCGYLYSEDPLFDPRLAALPPLFVVSPPEGVARQWVRASLDYALHQTAPAPRGGLHAPTQLPELVVREILRLHLASTPTEQGPFLAALRDPVLAPALAAIHASPGHKWTVLDLATQARVSPSLLDERFRAVLALAPIRYLTGWRMHVARGLLESSDLTVAAVARRVGYEAEEAFSRAFRRETGQSPSAVRTTSRA